MFKKMLVLAMVFGFCICSVQATHYNSTWVGGPSGSWEVSSNWDPSIVPENGATSTFSVSIGNADVTMEDGRTISSLDITGPLELRSHTGHCLKILDANVWTNIYEFEITRLDIDPNAPVINYGTINFDGTVNLKNDLDNHGFLEIYGISDASVEGNLRNYDSIQISPNSSFDSYEGPLNMGLIEIHGGTFSTKETVDNESTGTIEGFGVLYAVQQILNKGRITAFGGSLTVASGGTFENTGLVQSSQLTPIYIYSSMSPPEADVQNRGTIEIYTGGGVAFTQDLVNEPNAIIQLDGGTLSAPNITQSVDADLIGFGQIAGNITIEPNAVIEFTGPTNVFGDVNVSADATLRISDGTTIITGHTTCNNGTIHMIGGRVICQGGLTNNSCEIIWEPGIDSNAADYNLDGRVNLEDYAQFAKTWLWQASWR